MIYATHRWSLLGAAHSRHSPGVSGMLRFATNTSLMRISTPCLRRPRLVLLPYRDATQSGVGLQAVARGVPCVVSCAGALPELVQDSQPSLVVPPDDPRRLAEAIVANIDHDEVLRSAIYDHAAVHFAWPVVAQQLRSELRCLGVDGSGSPTGAAS